MATTIVTPAAEPSLSDLRTMLAGDTTTASETTETKPDTSETPATEEHTETAAETVEEKPAPDKSEEDEPLPEGVQKRIAKEVEKAARIQSEIDRAVSARKAKEAELAKLGDEKGSDPVKQPQSSTAAKRPQAGEPGHEKESWEQYEERRDAWLKAETLREFQQQQEQTAKASREKERWEKAVEKHGKEFPSLMKSACEVAPEGLQVAISGLDNWDVVAVHLAKDPAKLQSLSAEYQKNPYKAIATLGRIEAALTAEPKTATAAKDKPLPEPLKKVGGTASASGEDLQSSLEKGSMAHFKATITKLRK